MLGQNWLMRLASIFLAIACLVRPGSLDLCQRTECRCFHSNHTAQCAFETRQRLTLEATDFPKNLSIIELVGGKELRFGLGVLAHLNSLERVSIRNVTKVFVQKNSFANLTSTYRVRFEFSDSENLLLEEGSFKNFHSPISARVERINHLVIQRATFTWVSDLTVSRVAKLELLDEAFLLHNPLDNEGDTRLTEITLDRVNLEYLGRSTFHSTAKEVRIVKSVVKTIKTDAFDAIQIKGIVFEDSTINHIAKGAFSGRTLVDTLRMTNVTINEISTGALSSGTSQLIIEKSRIRNIHKGAINITVANVKLTGNTICRVHSMGVHLHKWNSITVANNTFKELHAEAISAPFTTSDNVPQVPECNFTGNTIYDFGPRSFDFALTEDVSVNIEDNYFVFNCHCDNMSSSLGNFITGSSVYSIIYNTSFCHVNHRYSRCYKLEEGPVHMWNFTEEVCRDGVTCEEVQRDAALPPVVPVITPLDDLAIHDEIERERLILGSVLVIFVFGMVIVALVSFVKCIKDHNYCGKTRVILRSTANHVFASTPSHDLTPTASAHSFSQFSVHEYAEVQRKKEAARDDSPLEDKATQTLPEELTQELIESLREKLNDPSNYPEARDMIEHLYDLIKTDDSCNRNETSSLNIDDLDKDDRYEAVSRRRSEPAKEVSHMWTRVPSPDKLLPHALYREVVSPDVTRPSLVCEYLEPRDKPSAHLYSEPNFTRVCDYAEPSDIAQHVYTELPNVLRNQKRPLPRPF